MTPPTPKEVIERHRARLMQIAGVVGVGFGISPTDPAKRCILVYITTEDRPQDLPRQLDGYDVEITRTPGGFRPR